MSAYEYVMFAAPKREQALLVWGCVHKMLQNIQSLFTSSEICPEKPASRTKFNISMEKKTERLFLKSTQHGWTFAQFAGVILEILTILRHRDRLQGPQNSFKKMPRRRRPMSRAAGSA